MMMSTSIKQDKIQTIQPNQPNNIVFKTIKPSVLIQLLPDKIHHKMECRKLILTLVSASNLPDVRNLGTMKVFAKVSIKGEPRTTMRTPIDFEGGTNPTWSFSFDYTIVEEAVQKQGICVTIKLFCDRTFARSKFIGEVNISIKSLFDRGIRTERALRYPVSGTRDGKLDILYSFGESFFVEKSSSDHVWGNALLGLFLLVGGALILFGDTVNNDDSFEVPEFVDSRNIRQIDDDNIAGESRGVGYIRTAGGELFYDAR